MNSHSNDVIAKLTCFLFGHDHQLLQLQSRDRARALICRRCGHPYADTFQDVWQLLRLRIKTQGGNSDDLPF